MKFLSYLSFLISIIALISSIRNHIRVIKSLRYEKEIFKTIERRITGNGKTEGLKIGDFESDK